MGEKRERRVCASIVVAGELNQICTSNGEPRQIRGLRIAEGCGWLKVPLSSNVSAESSSVIGVQSCLHTAIR